MYRRRTCPAMVNRSTLQLFVSVLLVGHAHSQAPGTYCGCSCCEGYHCTPHLYGWNLDDDCTDCGGCDCQSFCGQFCSYCSNPGLQGVCISDCDQVSPPPPPPPPPPSPGPSPPPPPSSSGATGEWTVSVWYALTGGADCTPDDKPAATATFTTAKCNCLVEVDGVCLASATLDVSSDDTIVADLYVGDGCNPEDALGGDTHIACDTCTPQDLPVGGVAIQITCPFDWIDWLSLLFICVLVVAACKVVHIGYRSVCVQANAPTNTVPHAAQVMLAAPLMLPPPETPVHVPASIPERASVESLSASSVAPPEGSVAYTVVYNSVIRAGVSSKSARVGEATVGEELFATKFETNSSGLERIKCDRGWLSVRAADGTLLLEKSEALTQAQQQAVLKEQLIRFHQLRLLALGTSHTQISIELVALDEKLARLAAAFFEKQEDLNNQLGKQYGCDLRSKTFPTMTPAAAARAGLLQQPVAPVGTLQPADPLTEFCATNKLTAFELALVELGVAEPSELSDVTDEQLTSIGLNAIQLKRVRRLVPYALDGDSETDDGGANASGGEETSAAVVVPASLDESVAVVSGGEEGSTIGGAE